MQKIEASERVLQAAAILWYSMTHGESIFGTLGGELATDKVSKPSGSDLNYCGSK